MPAKIHVNLSTTRLYEAALRRREGILGAEGQFVAQTGSHTGRSPRDKAFVHESSSAADIDWSDANAAVTAEEFDALYERVQAYLADRETFSHDCYVGSDERYRLPIRVITEFAWHNLFARNLFITPTASEASFQPGFTVIDAAAFTADPQHDGTRSGAFIWVNFKRKIVLIGGTRYAGEIKKSIFTVMNYLMPLQGVLPMHCSANVSREGKVAVFFGLSGTGKTTLSADASRLLIGDDEHGWSDEGVFNFEGGCYAKVINLSQSAEPEIWAAAHRFGTVLENVAVDPESAKLDLTSSVRTENTRAAYPLEYIPNIAPGSKAGQPTTIIMLTADAFGVLPPIARLTPAQAMYHFLSGYTAKVAGTELGVSEPTATFSTCFGAPFMVHYPAVYAKLLGERIAKYQVRCWLINTGWSGGPYGVGERMPIAHTRAMVNAALDGRLDAAEFVTEPVFGLAVPTSVPGVPAHLLDARGRWSDGAAYDLAAKRLAGLFAANFARFSQDVPKEVTEAAIRP
jgi:phosphoenolpyruvate carboxykinase (ATP)